MKRIAVIVAVLLLLVSSPVGAQVPSSVAQVINAGTGSWSGGTRVLVATVSKGSVKRVVAVGLSSATTAGLAIVVEAALLAATPAARTAVDKIRAYLASAGMVHNADGTYSKASANGGTWTDATKAAGRDHIVSVYLADIAAIPPPYGPQPNDGIYAMPGPVACQGQGYSDMWYTHNEGGINGVICRQTFGVTPPWHDALFMWAADGTAPVPGSAPATQQEVKDKLAADIASGSTAAKEAVEEAEDIYRQGLQGQPTSLDQPGSAPDTTVPPDVIDRTVTGPDGSPTTPRNSYNTQITNQLPPETVQDMEDPAQGTQITPEVSKEKPYTDPPYIGQYQLDAWPERPNFATRWTSFKTAIAASPIFQLPTGIGSVPGGGNPVISFNAGVFGNHSVDFSTWPSSVFSVLSALVMVACSFVAIKIVTLKHA